LLKHLNCTAYALEKPLNGSEAKANKPISVFDHNPFDFALASGVYDLEELTTVVIQAGGNLGAIKNDTIAAFTASLNQSFVLACEILGLFLR
jgi:hypothetical protein